MTDRRLIALARLARRYPGQLGEALLLAWAAATPDLVVDQTRPPPLRSMAMPVDPSTALETAAKIAAALTAETWKDARADGRGESGRGSPPGSRPSPGGNA